MLKIRTKENSMMKKGLLTGLGCAVLAGCQTGREQGAETRPVGKSVLSASQLKEATVAVSFNDHVRPILEERCLHCHNTREMPGKFSLETRTQAMADGRRIIPGKADRSVLIVALTTGNHALTMPAVGTAPPEAEIEVLKRWINAGASWPEGAVLKPRN